MTDENPTREQWWEELTEVFEQNYRPIYRAVYASVGSQHDVDDLLQRVFLKLPKGKPVKDFLKNPKGCLFKAAMNEAKSVHRSRESQKLADEPFEDLNLSADDGRDPRIGALRDALGQMDPEQVALLYARHVDGCSYLEIAEEYGLSVIAVSMRLYKAKARLKKLMGIQENERETQKTDDETGSGTSLTEAFE